MEFPQQSRKLAAITVIASVGLASAQDAIVKGVSHDLPAYEAVIFRGLVSTPILLAFLLWRGGAGKIWPQQPGLVALRSLILCSAYFAFVLSIATLPIATSVSIYFIMPFIVAALAGRGLGETVKPHRWIAISIAFAGMIIMVHPGSAAFQPAALLALYSAVGYAIGQMIGRHLALRMEPAVIANWQNFFYLAVALLIGLLVPFAKSASISNPSLAFLLRDWTWPNMEQTLLLSAMGVLSALASLGYIHAYRLAEANFVAPFEYTALLWAIGYGVVFFGDVPDAANLIGAGVVICAGVWMLRKDQQLST
ncbi:MAG: DMT family transporter [Hyphomicrobiales bacterium]